MKKIVIIIFLLSLFGCNINDKANNNIISKQNINYEQRKEDILNGSDLDSLKQIAQPNFHGSKYYFSEMIDNQTPAGRTEKVFSYDIEQRMTKLVFTNHENRRIYDIIEIDNYLLLVTICIKSDDLFDVQIIKYEDHKEEVLEEFKVLRPFDAPEFRQYNDGIYMLYQKIETQDMISGSRITQFVKLNDNKLQVLFENVSNLMDNEWLHINFNAVININDKIYFYLTKINFTPFESVVYVCQNNQCGAINQINKQHLVISAWASLGDELFYIGGRDSGDFSLYLYNPTTQNSEKINAGEDILRYFQTTFSANSFFDDRVIVKLRHSSSTKAQFALIEKQAESIGIDIIDFEDNEYVNCYSNSDYTFCIGFNGAFTLYP